MLYKIDRLTRSLSDFSRIVDVLEKAGASFVSVTQSFNTTTSMGRLMLYVLLSFAQFKRGVTGERIRDKIAASKRKGMWMGGPAPLGYEVRDRRLIVNEAEAAIVRHIFQRDVALGSGQALLDELRKQGYRTKRRPQADGSVKGGIPFARGMMFHLLGNRVYIGETVHKGTAHPGEHQAIIDPELWEAVQQGIGANSVERKNRRNSRDVSLIAGIIVDGHGRRMSPSHAVKSGRRYRYYITHASAITDDSTYHRRTIVASIVRRVQLMEDQITLTLHGAALATMLGVSIDDARPLELPAPIARVHCGKEVKLVMTDSVATDVAAILQGRHPPALSTRTLLTAKLSLAWDQQETMLGFA